MLRYGKTWEALKGPLDYFQAAAKAAAKKMEILTRVPQKAPVSRTQSPGDLDVQIDAYLKSIAELRSHKTWLAYSLSLNSFFKSCQCATLAEITEGVLKKFVKDMKEG